MTKLKLNQILLTFDSEETADYITRVCRRKGMDLESYITDNFEWDDNPGCFEKDKSELTAEDCDGCDYADRCPDVKGKV